MQRIPKNIHYYEYTIISIDATKKITPTLLQRLICFKNSLTLFSPLGSALPPKE